MEPHYNEDLGDHENYLVITDFLLYQGKQNKQDV